MGLLETTSISKNLQSVVIGSSKISTVE